MKQKYFIYNEVQYNEGDNILINFFDYRVCKTCRVNAKFLYYNTETREYHVEIYGKEYTYVENHFYKSLCTVKPRAPTVIVNNKKYTFSDELNIDCLLFAWIWYVFIMTVGVIFYDRIVIWIFASIIFFNYRNKKLKEAGYK